MAITKMRFLQGTELGRAAPTRALPDGRAAPARRCSAQGRHLGSVMVTEQLRAVCLPRVDEGSSVQAPSGVIPPPQPQDPPRDVGPPPRRPSPEIHTWAGFSRDWALPGPLSRFRVRELTFIRECRDIRGARRDRLTERMASPGSVRAHPNRPQ